MVAVMVGSGEEDDRRGGVGEAEAEKILIGID
jgi:hypothetical protein